MEKLKEEGKIENKPVEAAPPKPEPGQENTKEPQRRLSDDRRKKKKQSSSSSGSDSDRKHKSRKKKQKTETKRQSKGGSESDELPTEDLFGEKKGMKKGTKSDIFAEDMFADEFSSPSNASNAQTQQLNLQVALSFSNEPIIIFLISGQGESQPD